MLGKRPAVSVVRELVAVADVNGDGELDEREWIALARKGELMQIRRRICFKKRISRVPFISIREKLRRVAKRNSCELSSTHNARSCPVTLSKPHQFCQRVAETLCERTRRERSLGRSCLLRVCETEWTRLVVE